jgi:hypothetical protein
VHALTVHVSRAADWDEVERRAADVIRKYFRIPRRGPGSESVDELLATAEVEVHQSAVDPALFDATVVRRR